MARQEKSLAVCLEILQDYTAKDFSLFAVLTTADFYTKHTKEWEYANEIDHSKQEPLPHMFEWIEMEIAKNREE